MQTAVDINQNDYLQASFLSLRASQFRYIWPIRGVVLAIYGGVIYYFLHSLLVTLAFVGLMLVLILVMNYGVVYYRVKKEFSQHKLIQQGYTFEFDAQGCRLETVHGFTKYDWQDLLKWASNSKSIIIYPAPRVFYIIPKRLNSDEFDIQLLESYLMKQLKKVG